MKPNNNNALAIPSREFITEQQATVILASIREVGIWMSKSEDMIPGEARAAAENTFIGLCDRLDKIITDDARWSMTDTTQFYEELIQTQKSQQEFFAAQTESTKIVQKPHFQLKPMLMRDDTKFYAVWGDSTKPGGAIIGVGATPSAALIDFDSAFERTPAEQVSIILEQDTTPTETPADPENSNE